MRERLLATARQLANVFLSQPPARRILFAAVGLGSLGLILGVSWWLERPIYRTLFSDLSAKDAAAIISQLRAEKVPYRLVQGGTAIEVPAERLYELRLDLASQGLPEGGGVGFEVFDKQSLGMTDFMQRINYQRALQGELSRTISWLGGVESARVHLAIPERSLFVSQERRPSASVVVRLARGRTLSPAQVDGIVHLVAASVEGMNPDAVTVVDETGHVLTPERQQGELGAGVSGAALAYRQALERSYEERIESLLAPVVGRGNVIARVSATLDFARVERTEESVDPDRTALVSQRTVREESQQAQPATGTPGAGGNLTNEPAASQAGPHSERREETASYEVTKIVSHTVAPAGAIKRLSVAVLVAGTYREAGGKREFVPRPQEELDRYRELVKNAVGLSEERGDRIEVSSVPFAPPEKEAGGGLLALAGRWAPSLAVRVLGLAFALVAVLYGLRPALLALATRQPVGRRALLGPAAQRALPPGGLGGAVAELAAENQAVAEKHPERAAQLIRQWLEEREA